MAKETKEDNLKSYVVRQGFNYLSPVSTATGSVMKEYEAGEVVRLPAFKPSEMPHQLELLSD